MRDFAIAADLAVAAFGPAAAAPLGLYGILVLVWGPPRPAPSANATQTTPQATCPVRSLLRIDTSRPMLAALHPKYAQKGSVRNAEPDTYQTRRVRVVEVKAWPFRCARRAAHGL